MRNKGFSVVLILVIVALVAIGAYILGTSGLLNKYLPSLSPTPSPLASLSPTPNSTPTPVPSPTSTPIPGWKTYTNNQYGFEISFPSKYKALTDKENLYGWPNAAVLIYSGGQSYDLPIEVWNSQAEYVAKYPNLTASHITVKQKGNIYITLQNANSDPEVDQIIATFKFTN